MVVGLGWRSSALERVTLKTTATSMNEKWLYTVGWRAILILLLYNSRPVRQVYSAHLVSAHVPSNLHLTHTHSTYNASTQPHTHARTHIHTNRTHTYTRKNTHARTHTPHVTKAVQDAAYTHNAHTRMHTRDGRLAVAAKPRIGRMP